MESATAVAASRSPLFDANMRALEERFPHVARQLADIEPVSVRLPPPEDNIRIDDTLLYPVAAPEWVRLQMEGMEEFGERVAVAAVYANASGIILPMVTNLAKYCTAEQIKLSEMRCHDVGILAVFGIGLGYQLPILLKETPARNVVLVEPVPEFMLHSMEVVDWAALFECADERKITLHFCFSDQPAAISRAVEGVVVNTCRPFLDGTFFYFNYYSWALREAYSIFSESKRQIQMHSGFFEDEKVMMTNAFGNFAQNAFHQLAGKRYVEQRAPLFVCGAGPSLKTLIPEIKKWRQHVVLMSCGTALSPLLDAGIRPDLHCENENVPELIGILGAVRERHDFSGITLVATTTVNPAIPTMFDRTWFYQRGALTASTILSPDVRSVDGVDPLVSNAGFSVGATLGFRQIFLVGTDCGARRKDEHHISGAYKFETEEEKRKHDEMWAQRFDRQVPGNFGGKVYSAWHLDLSRRMFELAQSQHKVDLYNCCDGARINGAKPKAPRSLRFEATVDAGRILANIEGQMASFEKGEYVKKIPLDQALEALDEYTAWLRERLAKAAEGQSYYDFYRDICSLPNESIRRWHGARSFVGSSVESMIWVAAYFGDRIADADHRQSYYDYSMRQMAEYFDILFSQARDFLEGLRAQARDIGTH